MRKISAVIFDVDGTLVDSFPAYYSVFNRGISRFNLGPVSRAALANYLGEGLSLDEILRRILPPNTNENVIKDCKIRILEFFLEVEEKEVKPFPGIEELFRNIIDKGIKIGIATGRVSLQENERNRLKRLGLDRFINAIVTSKEIERRKTRPGCHY